MFLEIHKYTRYLVEIRRMLEDKGIYLSPKHLDKYITSYTRGEIRRGHHPVPAIPITVVFRKWSVSVFETYHKGHGYTHIKRTFFCAKGYREHCQSLGKSQCEYCKWTAAKEQELKKHEEDWYLHRR